MDSARSRPKLSAETVEAAREKARVCGRRSEYIPGMVCIQLHGHAGAHPMRWPSEAAITPVAEATHAR